MNVQEEKGKKSITLGSDGNSLVNLVIVIAVLFVLLKFIYVIYMLSDLSLDGYYANVFNWFTLPANLQHLVLRPWTLVSFMFTHESLFHVIANLLWLWLFGYILQDLTGNRKLVPLYLLGGWAGGLVFILVHYLLPSLHPNLAFASLIGANASVLAVAIATTTISPDYRIFPMISGGIPLWILTGLFVIIDFASISSGNIAFYLAHLAGAGMGFLFVYQMRRGKDLGSWLNNFFDWVDNLFNPDKPSRKNRNKQGQFYKVGSEKPYSKYPHVTQQRIDQILDKINQEGYHLLTDEEKDILRRAANEDDL